MGRSLARCLFQKGGEFRPTKRKRRRAWPVCESGNDIGQRPMSIPSTLQNVRFINGNGIGHRPSRKVETTSGNARCLFLLHPKTRVSLMETASGIARRGKWKWHRATPDVYSSTYTPHQNQIWFISVRIFLELRQFWGILGDFGQFLKIFGANNFFYFID